MEWLGGFVQGHLDFTAWFYWDAKSFCVFFAAGLISSSFSPSLPIPLCLHGACMYIASTPFVSTSFFQCDSAWWLPFTGLSWISYALSLVCSWARTFKHHSPSSSIMLMSLSSYGWGQWPWFCFSLFVFFDHASANFLGLATCLHVKAQINSYKEHYLSKISHQPEASVIHFISSVWNNDLISTASYNIQKIKKMKYCFSTVTATKSNCPQWTLSQMLITLFHVNVFFLTFYNRSTSRHWKEALIRKEKGMLHYRENSC